MVTAPDIIRLAGRPRNEAVGPAILAAARRLVVEHGYEAVTTRMIADAAGAGKPTLYRRWASKAELVLDAFLAQAIAEVDRGASEAVPVRAQLVGFIERTFAALAVTGPGVRGLMATAQNDAAFRDSFRRRFIRPRRDALTALLQGAVDRGELPADADLQGATMLVFGGVWYRLLLDETLDGAEAERITDLVLNGLRNGPTRSPAAR